DPAPASSFSGPWGSGPLPAGGLGGFFKTQGCLRPAWSPGRPGSDNPGTILFSLSLADLNRLIDRRVAEDLKAKTLALTSRVDGLQRENKGLLRRYESLERSVQVLKREGNWTYSAPDVPRSRWIKQGHDEDYAEEADNLIQSIKDNTLGLCSGGKYIDVSSAFILSSDRVLNPHLEQRAANAILRT
ncbi:hypothetical protein THAOC_00183, partial [Thalassiosira oceanica]